MLPSSLFIVVAFTVPSGAGIVTVLPSIEPPASGVVVLPLSMFAKACTVVVVPSAPAIGTLPSASVVVVVLLPYTAVMVKLSS
jgi:hypothetical protein